MRGMIVGDPRSFLVSCRGIENVKNVNQRGPGAHGLRLSDPQAIREETASQNSDMFQRQSVPWRHSLFPGEDFFGSKN